MNLEMNKVGKTQNLWQRFSLVTLSVLFLSLHIIYSTYVVVRRELTWSKVLNNWDSGWYTQIIEQGYEDHGGPRYAFYPLYPLCIFILKYLAQPFALSTPVMGSIFSSCCFLASTWLLLRWNEYGKHVPDHLKLPLTNLGWLLLIFSPASYVFHTHHTESLYLLLSLSAYVLLLRHSWILASILAGFCALTKNQGVFLALSIGLGAGLLGEERQSLSQRLKKLTLSGAISGGIFLTYPLFCYLKTGNFFAFYDAQLHWRPEMTEGSYFRALLFGNPWQNTNRGSVIRYFWFWFLWSMALGLLWKRKSVLAVYSILFVGVMPLSGEFVGTFRYSAVLFPVWFFGGSLLNSIRKKNVRMTVIATVMLILLFLNFMTTKDYLLGRWSY